MSSISQKLPRLRLDPVSYERLRQQVLHRDGGVNRAARCQTWKFTTNSFAVTPARIQKKT